MSDVRALNEAARAARAAGETERAIELYAELATVGEATAEPLITAHAIRHRADIQRERGELAAAADDYRCALAIYTEHAADSLPSANALRGLALLQAAAGDAAAAREAWRRARGIYAALGIAAGVAECDGYLGKT